MQCVADFIGNSFVVQRRLFASCLQQIKSYASRHRKAIRRKHIPSIIHPYHQNYKIIDFLIRCFYDHQFQGTQIIHSVTALIYFICISFISINFLIKQLIFCIRFASVKQDHFLICPLKCS